jgi:hypothetical protein
VLYWRNRGKVHKGNCEELEYLKVNAKTSFVDVVLADVAKSVTLFFMPVTAVVREVNKAISSSSDAQKTEHTSARD